MATKMEDDSEPLCEVCKGLPSKTMVQLQFWGKWFDIGPLRGLLDRNCPLCRLMVRTIAYNYRTGATNMLFSERIQQAVAEEMVCQVCVDTISFDRRIDGDWRCTPGPSLTVLGFLGKDMHDQDYRVLSIGQVRPCWAEVKTTSAEPFEWNDHNLYLAQAVPNGQIDIHRAKKHISGNKVSRLIADQECPLTLIDVQGHCLVASNTISSQQRRYMALSYVWGETAVPMLRSTQQNVQSLFQKGSLGGRGDIPLVIQDAMRFVGLMGERYLWVDALCIVQDDENTQTQLNHMGYIYNQAILTIVALSGDSADCPLPGVRPSSRPASPRPEVIDGILWYPMLPTLHAEFHRSKHATRAWTFQETFLASRCLFFSEHQTFLVQPDEHGKKRVTCEDINRPYPLSPGLNPLDPVLSLRDGGIELYENTAELYSQRELSFEWDVCKAFSGVASVLHYSTNRSNPQAEDKDKDKDINGHVVQDRMPHFVANLPVADFLLSLLWFPSDASDQRLGQRLSPQPRRRPGDPEQDSCFPSWSWAGWIGPVTYCFRKTWEPWPWRSSTGPGILSCLHTPWLTRDIANAKHPCHHTSGREELNIRQMVQSLHDTLRGREESDDDSNDVSPCTGDGDWSASDHWDDISTATSDHGRCCLDMATVYHPGPLPRIPATPLSPFSNHTSLQFWAFQVPASAFRFAAEIQTVRPLPEKTIYHCLGILDHGSGEQCGALMVHPRWKDLVSTLNKLKPGAVSPTPLEQQQQQSGRFHPQEGNDTSSDRYRLLLLAAARVTDGKKPGGGLGRGPRGRDVVWTTEIISERYSDDKDGGKERWCGCLLYVMLIKRCPGRSANTNTFERVTIGQLHPAAWKEVEPACEFTVLL